MVIMLPSWTWAADHAWRALSLTQAWSTDGDTFFWSANAASWSLSAELAFYAAFPFLTSAVRRHPARMALAATIGLAAYIVVTGDTGSARGNFHAFYVSPLARLPEFVVGMCAAELLPVLRRLRLTAASWTALELVAVLILLAVNAICQTGLPWLTEHAGTGLAAWTEGEGSAPAAVVLVALLAVGRGHVSRMLSWRPVVVLGEASFALYLGHEPALLLAHTPAGLPGYLVVVAAATWLAHRYVEQPGTKLANRMLDVWRCVLRSWCASSEEVFCSSSQPSWASWTAAMRRRASGRCPPLLMSETRDLGLDFPEFVPVIVEPSSRGPGGEHAFRICGAQQSHQADPGRILSAGDAEVQPGALASSVDHDDCGPVPRVETENVEAGEVDG